MPTVKVSTRIDIDENEIKEIVLKYLRADKKLALPPSITVDDIDGDYDGFTIEIEV